MTFDLSEREQWRDVAVIASEIQRIARQETGDRQRMQRLIGEQVDLLIDISRDMDKQVRRGVHTNPRRNPATLAVWGNPPGGLAKGAEQTVYVDQQIGFRVHDIRYEHVDDREYYKHTFASGVEMWSVLRGDRASTRHQHQDVLLTRPDGKSLWDDF